jgi:hypothetical protein
MTIPAGAACGTCGYWVSSDATVGDCRVHAPIAITTQQVRYLTLEAVWLQTKSADWCGQYQPTAGPVQAAPVYLAGGPTGTSLRHLNAAGSTLLKTGSGVVLAIDINTSSASSTLTVYDGTSAAGAVMASVDCSNRGTDIGGSGWPFSTGLFVTLTGTPDITIVWR